MGVFSFILPVSIGLGIRAKKYSQEEVLVERLISGDRQSIADIYDSYSAALYGVILKMVRRDDIAEDVLQETFIKVWKSCSQYDASRGRLYTWLVNIARNVAFDHLKSKSHRNNSKLEDIECLSLVIDSQNNTSDNPEIIGIRKMASSLKHDHQSIVDLVYFQGYTHSEAAEHLGIPVGTLKTRLRAAILALREHFN